MLIPFQFLKALLKKGAAPSQKFCFKRSFPPWTLNFWIFKFYVPFTMPTLWSIKINPEEYCGSNNFQHISVKWKEISTQDIRRKTHIIIKKYLCKRFSKQYILFLFNFFLSELYCQSRVALVIRIWCAWKDLYHLYKSCKLSLTWHKHWLNFLKMQILQDWVICVDRHTKKQQRAAF